MMYLCDQDITSPPGLHISGATGFKMVTDRVCPCLPVWDATKKKGFRLYYKEQMPLKQIKVEIVNHLHTWSPMFYGKKLIRTLDTHDIRTFCS